MLLRSHVLALPADRDWLPNVVFEAMACGRPVIMSPLPAIGEALTDGVEGYVLRAPQDLDGLITALRTLAAEPGRISRMGAAARRRVEADFDERKQAPRLLGLFTGEASLKVAS